MKLVFGFVFSCLYIAITAHPINEEHIFGDVLHGEIMGIEHVKAKMSRMHVNNGLAYAVYELTYPKVREISMKIHVLIQIP